MTIRETYEQLLERELAEIKAAAAGAKGYVATLKVEDDIEELLHWIRASIKKSHGEIRGLRKIIERHERHARKWGLDGVDRYWGGALARAERILGIEQAHRDELKEGLRMSKKVRREQDRELAKICREIRAKELKS